MPITSNFIFGVLSVPASHPISAPPRKDNLGRDWNPPSFNALAAAECAPKIRLNCIAPSQISTKLTERLINSFRISIGTEVQNKKVLQIIQKAMNHE